MNPRILPLEFTGGDNWQIANTIIGKYLIKLTTSNDRPIWHCSLIDRPDFEPIENYMCGFTLEEAKEICQREHEIRIYSLLTDSGRALLNLEASTT